MRFASNVDEEKGKVFTIVEEVTKENFFKRDGASSKMSSIFHGSNKNTLPIIG